MQNGNPELAVAEFKEVLRLSPDLLEARVNLGLAQHLLGQYADSTATLGPAARQQPELVPAQLFLGIGYLKLGEPRKAIPPLERTLQLEPANREAHRALATCRLQDGDYRRAAAEFRALFALQPDQGEAWYRLGRDYTGAASQVVRRMSVQHRRTAWGHRLAADLYSLSGRWEIAADEFREAIAADPKSPGLHARLGAVHLRLGQHSEAVKEFQRALEQNAKDPEARLGLAEVSLSQGDTTTAWEQIRMAWQTSPEVLLAESGFPRAPLNPDSVPRLIAALSTAPASPPTHFLLRGLYAVAGDAAAAQHRDALMRALVKDSPPGPAGPLALAAYLTLGEKRFGAGQWEASSDAFAAALALAPNRPDILYYLARSYQFLADDCFRRMEGLAPDSWRTHQMRAEAYAVRYNDSQAIEEYERAVRLRPDAAELYEELGALYLQNGKPDDGRSALEKALALEPASARSLYLLGQLLVTGREQEKGIPYLQKALRYDGSLLEARAMLGRAYLYAEKPAEAAAELEKAISLDHYGDLHYLLYRAYKGLGKTQLAQAALSRSAEMRKNSVERDRDKLGRWMKE